MSNIMIYDFKKFYTICSILLVCLIVLSCERSVSVSPPDEPPPDGFLFVNSSPPDARIFINGKDRRRTTPDSVTWLASNDYEVTLKKEYFRDTTFMIHVNERERTEIVVDYLSNPSMLGEINCTSTPSGVSIFLNGENTGLITPAVIGNLIPGPHIVRYEMPDHRTTELISYVYSSETTNMQATLVNTTIWQDYTVDNSEIPTNSLTDVLADSRGIIWVGTLDDGLIRFENDIFTNYRESNSNISNDQITCLEEGPKGNIWVGTFGGVWEIELPERTHQWNYKNSSLPDMYITDITRDGQIVILFATKKGIAIMERVAISDDDSEESDDNSDWEYTWKEVLTSVSGLASNNVTAVAVNGFYKWVGTETSGVTTFASRQLMTTYTNTEGLARNAVSSIAADRDGIVWIGHNPQVHTAGGISTFNGSTWNNLSHLIYGEKVTKVFVDSQNRKWVGTNRALYVITNNSVLRELVYESTGLNFINVKGISEDSDGNIWIATFNDGLIMARVDRLFQ